MEVPLIGLAIAVTFGLSGCGSATTVAPTPVAPPPTQLEAHPSAEVPLAPSGPSNEAQGEGPASAAPSPELPPPVPELARFHHALRGLEEGTRKRPVRVLWLGDSHGQADFWSGRLRHRLGERFGYGGPGFVHLGYKNYRHDGIKLAIDGKWSMRPKKPVGIKPQDDGRFGLGGLRFAGRSGGPRVTLTAPELTVGEPIRIDLCYRRPNEADAVSITSGPTTIRLDQAPVGKGPLLHETWAQPFPGKIEFVPHHQAELCGVVIEREAGGVVVDTLAINGARYGTFLAWDEESWRAEVRRRSPDLLILELGTNEAGDGMSHVDSIGRELSSLLARVRSEAPEVDCVVVSPTDRVDAEERVEALRQALAKGSTEAGCLFLDVHGHLGGKGAFKTLREEPEPKVQPDGIHLTIPGYFMLGDWTADRLLHGFPPKNTAPNPAR